MPSATLTSKGQVTIPKQVRQLLKLRSGDRLDFVVGENGQILIKPGGTDVTELRGLLHRPGQRALTVEAMNAAIRRHHSKRK